MSKKPIVAALLALWTVSLVTASDDMGAIDLVRDGEARAVIVHSDGAPVTTLRAIDDFVETIERATGVQLPVIEGADIGSIERDMNRIVLGPSELTAQLIPGSSDLEPEQYRIVTSGRNLIILARDRWHETGRRSSLVMAWALGQILDEYVGVTWLWPGDLGTVVPKHETIRIPPMDTSRQPALLERRFRQAEGESVQMWMAHTLQAGARKRFSFMHSFRAVGPNGDWYGRFHETNPGMLARNPKGEVEVFRGKTDRIKICISNPEVTDEIIRTWKAAGSPDFWDITPNDGKGFCTCDDCMALDQEYGGVSYDKDDVWNGRAGISLTDRYVWFWNQLVRRMRETNPRAEVGVYFYSTYRQPPKMLRLEEGVVGLMVHTLDFAHWRAWQKAGATKIGLRPNWWYMGAIGPNLPLRKQGAYVEQARDAGMFMLNFDSLFEFWATQGPNYYLVARLVSRPDLTTEDVISEYCDAFGPASGAIRDYLDYWDAYQDVVAYNVPAGGAVDTDPNGLYNRVCLEEFGQVLHPLQGHWLTLPFIFTESVLEDAEVILERALALASDRETRLRIEFLRDGLEQVRLASRVVERPREEREAFVGDLVRFARSREEKYGYWGQSGAKMMQDWGILGKEVNVEGM